jgi:hypothetical protein
MVRIRPQGHGCAVRRALSGVTGIRRASSCVRIVAIIFPRLPIAETTMRSPAPLAAEERKRARELALDEAALSLLAA